MTMNATQTMQALSAATHQWGMYLHVSCEGNGSEDSYMGELRQAALGLSDADYDTLRWEGECFLTFATEAECDTAFNLIVGDDGPTTANPYNGGVKVYALTCDDKGHLRGENT